MKNSSKILSSLVIALFLHFSLAAQTVDSNAVDGQIYFQLRPTAYLKAAGVNGVVNINSVACLKSLKQAYRLSRVTRPFYQASDSHLQRTYLLRFKDIKDVDSLISALKKNKDVVYAEKAPLFKIFYTPNDPKYNFSPNNRWYLTLIQAEKAWDIQKGNPKVKVAVLDNAVYTGHPDLKSKIVAAIDLADNDTDPSPPKQNMDWTHGTHVAGLAAGATDNGVGIASIGFNISLMAVKISNDSSDGKSMSVGYQGIVWAADHGADVISMSWGGPGYYQTGQNVINYAYNKGCVLVSAAGNDGNTTLSYPASYEHVISVASVNSDDAKSSFSQYGEDIDVCAPGGSTKRGYGIFSTVDYATSKYGFMEGTSMSTPIVSGLAGLMLSEDSTLTPEKLEGILKATCDNIDTQNPGFAGQLGAGRINAFKAIEAVKDSMALHTVVANFKANSVSIPEGDNVSFTDLSIGNPVSWKWTFEGGTPENSSEQNPSNIHYAKAGSYKVTLTVSDGTHSNTETKTNYILVFPLVSGAWQPQSTGFTAQSTGINYISIVNPDVVWANAYDGSGNDANLQEFTKTVNGGNTWKPGTYSGVPGGYTVSCIMAIDTTHAWIAMYSNNSIAHGGIYATADGGKTWSHQSTASFGDTASFPDVVYFWDGQHGVCMGDPVNGYFEVYTTENGGVNWNRVPSGNIPPSLSGEYGYVNLYDTYGDIIWFGTNKGRVFKSTDRGHHWTVATTGLSDFSNLSFHNDSIGIATHTTYSQSDGTIMAFKMVRSKDGGKTWTVVTPQGPVFKSDVEAVPEAPGFLISTGISQDLAQSGSAYSLDDGDTWTMLDDSIQYTTVKFYNSAVGWAGGFTVNAATRGIWKWLGIPTDVQEIGEHSRVCVYPNPSPGVVHFYVPEAKKIFSISIYDMSGKLVKVIHNRMVIDSSHKYTLDLSRLKNGIYIAVLKGQQTVIKKKIIIK